MSSNSRCTCHNTLVVKDLNRWFKEKWVDVSRRDKDGKHPPCGRGKAKKSSKGYPKCRPSVKVSDKTPKTSGSMSSGQKRAATKRKRAKKQGVGGKPTIVKEDNPVNVPEDFGRFFDKDYRYEQTYGDLRSNQEVPMKDARFGPSSDKRDQMMARTKRNIIDNVDRLQHEEFNHRLQLGNYLTRPHGDMSNEELRERLATVRPYVRDAEGRIAPVPLSDDGKTHQRFHPNSGPERWTLEQERNLRELESQPTTFYEENPFSEQFQDFYRSEPMEIAHQLLKEQTTLANHMGLTEEEFRRRAKAQGTVGNLYNMPSTDAITGETVQPSKVPKLSTPKDPRDMTQTSLGQFDKMDLAFSFIKERKSPEAMRRKLEYDKRYEKTPERREYQRELHAERRKRGIYGSGDHMDVSHSQGGRLTLEPEHSNRARHFKDKGTLRRVAVR